MPKCRQTLNELARVSRPGPPGTQDLQQFGRQHRVAILLSFTLLNTQDHALAVNGGWSECDGLRDAQACGIAGGQDSAMFPSPDAAQKLNDFLGAENNGQFFRHLGNRDEIGKGPVFLQSDSVEEVQRCDGDDDGTCRKLPFIRQVKLVGPNVLRSQNFRRLLEILCESGDLLNVGLLGVHG